MRHHDTMTVYRASAGSGKTFTLAVRYIELLIQNPTAYRETLAVTFTNKATEEMKLRILSQLYGLSHSLKDSESYMQKITDDLGVSREKIREMAEKSLHMVLHDYSNFNVETIDAFFQRVLRNLARELDLTTNLRVELNNNEVEEIAVDRMVSDLKGNDRVLKWIIAYINQRMDAGENWKVIDGIKTFGKKIFDEEYKEHSKVLNERFEDDKFFDSYCEQLRQAASGADEHMKEYGDRFFHLLDTAGYDINSLSRGKNGAAGYFMKLQKGDYSSDKMLNTYVMAAMEGPEGWVKKGDLKGPLANLASEELVPILKRAEEDRAKCALVANSSKVILKHINELRLLQYIEHQVMEVNREENKFLLANTQNVLDELMNDTDAPFVFEKIGGRIKHTMIDEFQDTSSIQWKNFKKLLNECMAADESENLIVGDVKQSIYRWRDGDWKLLNDIAADSDLKRRKVNIQSLNTNYRSETNIIRFNNVFFPIAAPIERDILENDGGTDTADITDIYSAENVFQNFPKDKDEHGMIEITLLPDADYAEGCLTMTRDYILDLYEAGAKDEDIAIITRSNGEISLLANYLQSEIPGHNFVSDEAFRLDSSMAVNIMIDAMRSLYDQRDTLIRAQLAKDYQMYVCEKMVDDTLFRTLEGINAHLPLMFTEAPGRILGLPLNDMAEKIFEIFGLETLAGDAAYVNSFFDIMNAYTQRNIPDLGMFLEAWDASLHNKTVHGGDLNGVRLLTIHKSKGLEFDHVILPFLDWDMDKGDTLWCSTNISPYSAIPIMPVPSKGLKNTVYAQDYHNEKLQKSIDNLNLLYVAFTRAGKNLMVIGRNSYSASKKSIATAKRSGMIQMIIPQLSEALTGSAVSGDITNNAEPIIFSFGQMYVKNRTRSTSQNVFLQHSDPIEVPLCAQKAEIEFRQSNRSRDFVSGDDMAPDNQRFITAGTVMHRVLSEIHHADDVERVLTDFVQEGVITNSAGDMSRDTISRLIRSRIENNKHAVVNRWFSAEVTVFNECAILSYDKETGEMCEHRPDRVVQDGDIITVIDFKFGTPRPHYHDQVMGYMTLLKDMGYKNVKGYIWYVYKNVIEEVCE